MLINENLTNAILGAAVEVHKALGPELLESAYEECLCRELTLRGLAYQRQVPLALNYKGVIIDCGYRVDMVVEHSVVLELKSVDNLEPVHEAQLLTYLRLSGVKVRLLINFKVAVLRRGVIRRVL